MKLSLAMMLMTFGAVVTFHTKPAMAQDSASKPLQAGPIILSDTQGVDFSAYMRRLRDDILRNWDPLIPDEASPPQLKKGVVGIRFTILPDGSIGSMKLETASGDVQFDKAAWYAITAEGKFPALPSAFHGPQLEVRMGFFYNTTSSPATTSAAPSRAAAQPSTGKKLLRRWLSSPIPRASTLVTTCAAFTTPSNVIGLHSFRRQLKLPG